MSNTTIIAALYAANNVYCDPEHPLKGGASFYQPFYLDHRNLLSFPQSRDIILAALEAHLPDRRDFDLLAGNETAGIALAGLLAQHQNIPMVYIRKQPKDGGTKQQIEGVLTAGQRVIIIDDTLVTGGNIKRAAAAVARVGATVIAALVISIVREDVVQRLRQDKIDTRWLVTFQDIFQWGKRNHRFTPVSQQAIEEYLANPTGWGEKHGFT